MIYVGGGVVCVYLCSSFSYVRMCGCMDTVSSGTNGWYLVRLIYLGGCEWK